MPTADHPAPFSRAEYLRLAALRSRVRERLLLGDGPDDVASWRRPDESGGAR